MITSPARRWISNYSVVTVVGYIPSTSPAAVWAALTAATRGRRVVVLQALLLVHNTMMAFCGPQVLLRSHFLSSNKPIKASGFGGVE